jgi:regulatory protein
MVNAAYIDGLKMLGRRELSEAQVRQRLVRKGHDADAIDQAVERLREGRAIDDVRTAEAIARTEIVLKRRGRRRVTQAIEQAGIAASTARVAVADVFSTVDDEGLLESALVSRLRGRSRIEDDAECRRLYRYLLSQGFEHEHVAKALKARR